MKFVAIIPARYASTRFPGKPLVDICGRPMIQWVYETVASIIDDVYVATDDDRIYDTVKSFGGDVVMTSTEHRSGTDRCNEALSKIEEITSKQFDVVINIQGDEPFIATEQIEALKSCFNEQTTDIATLVKPFSEKEDIFNANSPKVVRGVDGNALYFSRSVIPYLRNQEQAQWHKLHTYYKHIGIYAYRSQVLREITSLPQGELEKAESLEQLRWLENGYTIKTAVTTHESLAVDTPEDLEKVIDTIKNK